MTKCSFCGKEESFHKGLHLLKNDGSVQYLCSSKCRRNALNLKRDKRKVLWTEAYRDKRTKEIAKEDLKKAEKEQNE